MVGSNSFPKGGLLELGHQLMGLREMIRPWDSTSEDESIHDEAAVLLGGDENLAGTYLARMDPEEDYSSFRQENGFGSGIGVLSQPPWCWDYNYAPWCPACQNLQPEWEGFAEWGEDLEINVAKVDVTEQTGMSGRFIITALPTIYHCKDGEIRRYQGPRTKNDFINFISEKEWKSIEPVSSWFGPSSILMSAMSALFRLSMYVRTCYDYFIEDLGLPVWSSYTIFALATLLSGLLLGLLMIYVADCLCPSKRRKPQSYPSKKPLSEFSQPLKKMIEEQEAAAEDISEEVAESKEGTNKDFPHSTVRQRPVGPSLPPDQS
ncbi:thioredoxin-related transmembrane protein 1 [Octodon degus]|uniref:Thioredoxin-related transmembrane protein 1 n=1 Tax=Octodon degus TaxID=10160 RepID=A0A6P6F5L6_OCTDE|nr:thioredoxin-related transmembrane protein 1 [Octodon degus]